MESFKGKENFGLLMSSRTGSEDTLNIAIHKIYFHITYFQIPGLFKTNLKMSE